MSTARFVEGIGLEAILSKPPNRVSYRHSRTAGQHVDMAIVGPTIFEPPNAKRTRTATRSARADAFRQNGEPRHNPSSNATTLPGAYLPGCRTGCDRHLHNTICGSRTIGCREHHRVRRAISRMSTCMIVHVCKSRHTGRQKRSSSSAVLHCRHVDM